MGKHRPDSRAIWVVPQQFSRGLYALMETMMKDGVRDETGGDRPHRMVQRRPITRSLRIHAIYRQLAVAVQVRWTDRGRRSGAGSPGPLLTDLRRLSNPGHTDQITIEGQKCLTPLVLKM